MGLKLFPGRCYPGNNICVPANRPPGAGGLRQVICQDALDAAATWGRAGSDIRSLQDKMVALRFIISPEDKLYSYTLQPVDA